MAVVSLKSSREKLGCQGSERLFDRDQDFADVRPQAVDVQQHEQRAGRPHPQELIEIASHALPAVHLRSLDVTQHGTIAMERFA